MLIFNLTLNRQLTTLEGSPVTVKQILVHAESCQAVGLKAPAIRIICSPELATSLREEGKDPIKWIQSKLSPSLGKLWVDAPKAPAIPAVPEAPSADDLATRFAGIV